MVLKGHTGSVLCLQYNEQVIVTGSSDSTIRYICMCVGGGGGGSTCIIWCTNTQFSWLSL